MTIPTFTLKGSALELLDTDDPTALDSITLTPNTRGQTVSIGGVLYRPEPITVTLDEDGTINGQLGVRLLANDPSVELDSPLQWRVQLTTSEGFPRQPKPWWFEAGAANTTVLLAEVSPSPLLSAQGMTRGPRGVDDIRVVGTPDALRLEFLFGGETVGDPIDLYIAEVDGGTPYDTSDGFIDGGTI